jgi:putative transposase
MKDLKLADGRDRLVRHGHGPDRAIQTGIGPVEVLCVKIRDRGATSNGERIRFTSASTVIRRALRSARQTRV